MKWMTAGLVVLALALGLGLGRATAPHPEPDLTTLASFRQALDDPDWLTRSHRLSGFLQALTPANLPGALEALEPRLPWLVTDELRVFMLAWTRFDPLGALEHVLAWPAQFRRNGSGAAIYAWAFREPAAALQALDSVEDPELREFMEARLVAGWTHGPHKQSAAEFIASLPESPRRFAYLGMLAWELSKAGPEAVTKWAEAVPESAGRYKASVFLKASSTLAAIDPHRTAQWVEAHQDRSYADGAARVVARAWATSDAPSAMAWLTGLRPGAQRDRAVSATFGAWLERSPEEAAPWLRGETPKRALDPGVRLMVERTRAETPASALEWARAIDDPQLRRRMIAGLGPARRPVADSPPQ
jgi:hypothetical protein